MTLDLISAIQKNDKEAKRMLFDLYFSKFAVIAARYAKSAGQADDLIDLAFKNTYLKLLNHRFDPSADSEAYIENVFISECIAFVKGIRSEYYVASTVHATSGENSKNYNLFENNEVLDFNTIDTTNMISALQKMVPAQRLVFNLHVVDGFSLQEVATKLETSEETVKSNLEKARFNFQKNIEKDLKRNSLV
jgi:RNA polymerase sigma-70 factor (ECF subfamily)